jgi:hypothetical protein
VAGGRVALDVATEYPWDGTVTVTVRDAPPGPWTLSLRVPSWAAAATVSVPGAAPRPATGPTLDVHRADFGVTSAPAACRCPVERSTEQPAR